jgi:flavin reductase (DIM6/NTAB) family NADH-FMN oxidoreductase RutF
MNSIETSHLSLPEIMLLEQKFRASLINSLTGFKSLALIGSINKLGQNNLAIFNSIFHVGAHPPLIGFINRPDSVERHTLSNILDNRFYTINHVNENNYKQAHQTSARYPKEVSEFEATGLVSEFKDGFEAPYVKDSNIQIGVELREQINIKANNTILIIGEIKHIYFPANCLFEDGFIDIEKAQSITCSGLDSYHKTIKISRLSYAKPDKIAIEI